MVVAQSGSASSEVRSKRQLMRVPAVLKGALVKHRQGIGRSLNVGSEHARRVWRCSGLHQLATGSCRVAQEFHVANGITRDSQHFTDTCLMNERTTDNRTDNRTDNTTDNTTDNGQQHVGWTYGSKHSVISPAHCWCKVRGFDRDRSGFDRLQTGLCCGPAVKIKYRTAGRAGL